MNICFTYIVFIVILNACWSIYLILSLGRGPPLKIVSWKITKIGLFVCLYHKKIKKPFLTDHHQSDVREPPQVENGWPIGGIIFRSQTFVTCLCWCSSELWHWLVNKKDKCLRRLQRGPLRTRLKCGLYQKVSLLLILTQTSLFRLSKVCLDAGKSV